MCVCAPSPPRLSTPSDSLSLTNRCAKGIFRRNSSSPLSNPRNFPLFFHRPFRPHRENKEIETMHSISRYSTRRWLPLHHAVSQGDDGPARHSRAPSHSAIRSSSPLHASSLPGPSHALKLYPRPKSPSQLPPTVHGAASSPL